MTWVDWTIVIVLVASTIGGLAQGFFRTACSLIGIIFGLSLAVWNYPLVAARLISFVPNEHVANTIAFFLIFIVVIVIFSILGALLGRALKWIGLGCLDAIGGAALGFMQGVVLVAIAILVAVAFFPGASWLAQAHLPRQFISALNLSTKITPQDLAERLRHGLRLLEQDSPGWMHPGKPST